MKLMETEIIPALLKVETGLPNFIPLKFISQSNLPLLFDFSFTDLL